MKKASIIIGVVLALSVSARAWAETRIGVAMATFDNPYLTTLRHHLDAKAKTLPTVSLQYEDGRGDVVQQLNQVQAFINQKVDAIIVVPVDTAATKRITTAAVAAKIPLVYVNRKPDDPSLPIGVVTVTSDEVQAGTLEMEFLAKQMGGKGNVAIIMGELSQNATHARTKGLLDVIQRYPDIKIVEKQTGSWLRDKGMDLMSNWLITGVKIDAVASNNDEMGIGAAMALAQVGKKGSIPVAGADGCDDGIAAVKSGLLTVSVLQDAKAQAYGAIDAATRMAQGEKVESVVFPYKLITRDNIDQIVASQK